ncbi:MAG: GFA family protein [Kofleriaceae bacterium]|nr:GFA family protein [Kofleriaceae bacterium]
MCTKKGILHLIVEKSELAILSGEDSLQNYEFGTKTAKHYFCRECGIHPFYVPRSHPNGYSVNFRCLEPYDELRSEFKIRAFDGRNWEKNIHSIS